MDFIKNKANNAFMAVATPFIGVLKETRFLEKGILTPEEFVIAGDQLTHKCPTWSWEGGTEKLANKNLPQERQFLITRGVPCSKRIKDIKDCAATEHEVEDGWMAADNPDSMGGGKDSKTGGMADQAMDIDDIDNQEAEAAVDIDEE